MWSENLASKVVALFFLCVCEGGGDFILFVLFFLLISSFPANTTSSHHVFRPIAGTVCNTLRIDSVPNLAQIFRLCSNAILETLEKNALVRRAAANLLCFLVSGRDPSDFFSVSSELKGIYSVLRRVESSDIDETTKRLAGAAAYEIDEIMKSFMLLDGSRKKKEFHIRVL